MSASLLDGAVAGDDQALRELVQRYHDRVYRFGVRVCRDSFDADDAVQEAFITLARRPDVQQSPSVVAWLFTVVKNACIAMLRAVLTQGRTPLSQVADAVEVRDPALSPEASLERFQLVAQVNAAIASLAPQLRAVVILRDLEGLSGEETARRLGLEVAAMKTRLHRGRESIRQALAASQG